MSDNKYKIFRNFMVNELGISRDDIKEWTMEAVKETVGKIVRGYNLNDLIESAARQNLNGAFRGDSEAKRRVEEAVQSMLSEKYKIVITER